MNFYQQLGPLVFGTRLKRISDYFLSEINKVYTELGIPFEASWFGVFYLLDKHENLSIFEIADSLEVSHSAISQLVKNLKSRKLIHLIASTDDKRKKEISLTAEGKVLLESIKPIWVALNAVMSEELKTTELLGQLTILEKGFEVEPLSQKIKTKIDV